jgi:hypothetical protein
VNDIVRGWAHKAVFQSRLSPSCAIPVSLAESPIAFFVAQRGGVPDCTKSGGPPGFVGVAGSIGSPTCSAPPAGRVRRNLPLHARRERQRQGALTQWDSLCEGSSGPGPHRCASARTTRATPRLGGQRNLQYIYVFSNDGKKLLKTLGERTAAGPTHAISAGRRTWLSADGRIPSPTVWTPSRALIPRQRDELPRRVRRHGQRAGPVHGVHAIAVGPEDDLRARSVWRPHHVFKTTPIAERSIS